MSTRSNPKVSILEAASRIVGRDGAAHLTIDAVAAEAGLSKGGVLYHFPNKRSMLQGMLDLVIDGVSERTSSFRAELGEGAGVKLRAQLQAEAEQSAEEQALSLALLAAAAEDPELLGPARDFASKTFQDIRAESDDAEFSSILLLATEGIRFMSMLDLLPFTANERRSIQQRLLKLAAGNTE